VTSKSVGETNVLPRAPPPRAAPPLASPSPPQHARFPLEPQAQRADLPPRAPSPPPSLSGMLRGRALAVKRTGSTWPGWIGTDDAARRRHPGAEGSGNIRVT